MIFRWLIPSLILPRLGFSCFGLGRKVRWGMRARILSLNTGAPAAMEWNGKSVLSSMRKSPVPGPLVVHLDHIEGNSFAQPQFHGTPDSVLYALGLPSAAEFMRELGGGEYAPGYTGETLTLDAFDEAKVGAGDVFRIGTVLAQATYPRIPCVKLNFRTQNADGQAAMQRCGRSGVYFKVLQAGKIDLTDPVERVESARHPISIQEIYRHLIEGKKLSPELAAAARANGSVPERLLGKLV
jgi:MOSC domain-containing protein YiiM